jgi:hypothetical protein
VGNRVWRHNKSYGIVPEGDSESMLWAMIDQESIVEQEANFQGKG